MSSPAAENCSGQPVGAALNHLGFCIVAARDERFFGLTSGDRARKSIAKRTLAQECDWTEAPGRPGPLLLVRGDFVIDDALFGAMIGRTGAALAASGVSGEVAIVHSAGAEDRDEAMRLIQGEAAGPGQITILRPMDLKPNGEENSLRKKFNPLILKIPEHGISEIEARLFGASYKGVTDFVTKRVWPWPALRATRWCALRGITPNQVTSLSLILVALAFWLFWIGAFVPGIVAAWGMCFLDTVDGKLARVTLASTRWGNAYDHGIDLIHPPFWYWAWFHGLGPAEGQHMVAFWIVVAGYVIGRLQEGWFLWRFKFELHAWRKIDSLFREITARRNPNLAILTMAALAGAPALGLTLVAAWTSISLAFHFARIAQAEIAARRGQQPISWLAATPSRVPAA